ncbi:epoxide hydrolase [Phyllobacterium salinisoli]|uniref:Epoxide hydrolase n=2 Tax=Phyllobacterium salinisoli TaxID=1899321 RepID=A0A368JXE1_9HYPH|nr:epoxide hydrolase [Phyllobacterium salinisoli]
MRHITSSSPNQHRHMNDSVSRRDVIQAGAVLAVASSFSFGFAGSPAAAAAIAPFEVSVPQVALDDLRRRLDTVRWPEPETEQGWSQGVPLDRLQRLVEYWRTAYDWRRFEAQINAFPQFRTDIDGLGFHFLHVRSRHEGALPIILTHGWPGSVIEFLKVIGPLTDPTAHGGRAEDAFHVVIPSLPGYGFSDKPSAPGWDAGRIARAWAELMRVLGYTHWVAQGGDWGAVVTNMLALQKPPGLAAIHLNLPLATPTNLQMEEATAAEREAIAALQMFVTDGRGYYQIQSTRPQTLGYALADSPAGLAAWIYEKFQAWTDNSGDPASALTRDEMLDDITLYWLTNTAVSSARLYRENARIGMNQGVVDFPVGISIFPGEIFRTPRSWADKFYPNIIHWNELDKGGHFAAFEQPVLFTQELRDCFRGLRDAYRIDPDDR